MAKFGLNDILLHKFKERQTIDPLLSLDQVIDIQQGQYLLADYGTMDIEQAEKDYARVVDVLWQHYILDTETNKLTPYNGLMTIEDARNLFAPSKTTTKILLTAYWEGFNIPKEDKYEKFNFVEDTVLVDRVLEGCPLKDNGSFLPKVTGIDTEKDMYMLSNGCYVGRKKLEEDCIDAFGEEALWYWEFKTNEGWIPLSNKRITFTEALSFSALERRPLYSLGYLIEK